MSAHTVVRCGDRFTRWRTFWRLVLNSVAVSAKIPAFLRRAASNWALVMRAMA